jgi:thioredoxin reductase (NADPH)
MSEIKVFGTETCHDTMRSRQHLAERGIDYEFVDISQDENAERQVVQWGEGKRRIPVIEIRNNGETQRITEPSNAELDQALSEEAA